MGIIMALPGAIMVMLGPIGGTFADRHSRRKIIIFSDLFSGIALISLAAFIYFIPVSTGIIIGWIIFVSILLAIFSSFFNPAIVSSIPDIVPKDKLPGANTLNQLSDQISLLIGQALGGTFFRIFGGPVIFLIDGLTFLFSAGSETFIDIPQEIPSNKGNSWREKYREFKDDFVEGLQYIWNTSGLRELFFVSAFLNFFIMPIIVNLPFYVEDYLGIGKDWFGYLLGIYGVGSFLGYMFGSIFKISNKIRQVLIITFLILESFSYFSLGLIHKVSSAMIIAVLAGFFSGFVMLYITVILQSTTPSNIRGRIFGVLGTLAGSIAPLGMASGGLIFDLIGRNIPIMYGSCGLMLALLSITVSFNKNFRTYLSHDLSENLTTSK
jgi:MFS family permease